MKHIISYDDLQYCEHHVALELYAFGEGTQNEGRGDEGKHALEHGEREFGNASGGQAVHAYTA